MVEILEVNTKDQQRKTLNNKILPKAGLPLKFVSVMPTIGKDYSGLF